MIRSDLAGTPDHPVLPSFSIRSYRNGDVGHWTAIHRAADHHHDIDDASFQGIFGDDLEELQRRQWYLIDPHGQAIGTGTAWYGSGRFSTDWGRIHWVAVIPDYQGRGLAKSLMSTLCSRLRDCGHAKAYLKTIDLRLNAIRLYQLFGFEPLIDSVEDENVWKWIFDQISAYVAAETKLSSEGGHRPHPL